MYQKECHHKEHNVPIVLNNLNKNKKKKSIYWLIFLILKPIPRQIENIDQISIQHIPLFRIIINKPEIVNF